MTFRRLLVVLAVLAVLPLLWSWLGSERRRIERQIDHLEERVSKSGEESALEQIAAARAITELFASSFEIRAEQLGFSTRDPQELMRFIARHRATSDRIDMRITGSRLSLAPEHRRATQTADFHFLSGGPLGSSSETYRVQVNWLEQEGRWLIDYVDLIEIR